MQRHLTLNYFIIATLAFTSLIYYAQSAKISDSFAKLNNIASTSSIDENHMIKQQDMSLLLNQQKKNMTFKVGSTFSNMIVTSKYALVGKYRTMIFGVLKKLNFKTMKIETIIFKRPYIGFQDGMIQVADLRNGDIAVGQGTYIFIFNNQTLELKQTIKGDETVGEISVQFEKSVCLVKRGEYNILTFELKKDKKTNKYIQILATYDYSFTPTITYPTGEQTAVTINTVRGCEVAQWDDTEVILSISHNPKDYFLEMTNVAVSFSESFFVVWNKQTYHYQFYHLQDDYQITLLKSIVIDQNTYKKGEITSDDNNLFISTSGSSNQNSIAKVDLNTHNFQLLVDQQGKFNNQLDFNLFNSKINRIITLAFKNQHDYYLQLRSLDDLTILDQYLLSLDFIVEAYKLVGNIAWEKNFSLVTKTQIENSQFDSRIFLFSIEGDKIRNLNVQGLVSFEFVKACYKYVVTSQYASRVSYDYMRILHSSNFSIASSIYSRNINHGTIIVEKNILTFTQYFGGCQIYDLEQSLQRKSILYKDSQVRSLDRFVTIVFPKRGIIYQTPIKQYSTKNLVTKAVYDISQTSVKKIFKLDGELPCQSPKYYTPSKKEIEILGKNACNYIFFIQLDQKHQNHYLGRYSQCNQKLDKFLISDIDAGTLSVLTISSDNKYVIIMLDRYPLNDVLLQIRPINNITHLTYHQIVRRHDGLFQADVDFINDTMILIHATYEISVVYITPNIETSLKDTGSVNGNQNYSLEKEGKVVQN